jgi:hypothetical protein
MRKCILCNNFLYNMYSHENKLQKFIFIHPVHVYEYTCVCVLQFQSRIGRMPRRFRCRTSITIIEIHIRFHCVLLRNNAIAKHRRVSHSSVDGRILQLDTKIVVVPCPRDDANETFRISFPSKYTKTIVNNNRSQCWVNEYVAWGLILRHRPLQIHCTHCAKNKLYKIYIYI